MWQTSKQTQDMFFYKDLLTPLLSLTQTHIHGSSRADTHHVHDQMSAGIALVCRLLETGVLQQTGETGV